MEWAKRKSREYSIRFDTLRSGCRRSCVPRLSDLEREESDRTTDCGSGKHVRGIVQPEHYARYRDEQRERHQQPHEPRKVRERHEREGDGVERVTGGKAELVERLAGQEDLSVL